MGKPPGRLALGPTMLATLAPADVDARFTDDASQLDEPVHLPTLHRQLAMVREQGFALNDGLTERGIVAIGRALHGPDGTLAALSIALPSARWSSERLPSCARALAFAVQAVEGDLASR